MSDEARQCADGEPSTVSPSEGTGLKTFLLCVISSGE
ncbi:MAG: hypothetical protein ACI9JZ_002933 [Lentimonas sp.]|jgi:hypothetical protein